MTASLSTHERQLLLPRRGEPRHGGHRGRVVVEGLVARARVREDHEVPERVAAPRARRQRRRAVPGQVERERRPLADRAVRRRQGPRAAADVGDVQQPARLRRRVGLRRAPVRRSRDDDGDQGAGEVRPMRGSCNEADHPTFAEDDEGAAGGVHRVE